MQSVWRQTDLLWNNCVSLKKCAIQGRNEVTWSPGQEASLAPPCSNLKSFGSKCAVEKSTCDIVEPFRRPSHSFGAPTVIRPLVNYVPLPPLVTPLVQLYPFWPISLRFFDLFALSKHMIRVSVERRACCRWFFKDQVLLLCRNKVIALWPIILATISLTQLHTKVLSVCSMQTKPLFLPQRLPAFPTVCTLSLISGYFKQDWYCSAALTPEAKHTNL